MMIYNTKSSKYDPINEGSFKIIRLNRVGAYALICRLGYTLKRSVTTDQLKMITRK